MGRRTADGFDYRRKRVPVDQWAPAHHEVDVSVSIHVPEKRPIPPFDETRSAPDSRERANGTVHSTGHERPRPGEELFRSGARGRFSFSRHGYCPSGSCAVVSTSPPLRFDAAPPSRSPIWRTKPTSAGAEACTASRTSTRAADRAVP